MSYKIKLPTLPAFIFTIKLLALIPFFFILGCNGGGGGSDEGPNSEYFQSESYMWNHPDRINRVIVIDFDNDNDLDIVNTAFVENSIPQSFSKLIAYKNDGNANFTDVSSEVFQNAIWGNNNDHAVADFNGDNLMDLFLPESGPDIPPFPGGQSRIYIQNQDGQLIDETMERLPIRNAFTHYCAIGDVDNDGDLDICMNHIGGEVTIPELYINNGSGYFSVSSTNKLYYKGFNASLFLDIDKDGDSDLILGGPVGDRDVLLLNDGKGNFNPSPQTVFPPRYGGSEGNTIEIVSSDLNADGWPDLLLNTTIGYTVLFTQYLINNQDGTFYDASSLIPDNHGNDIFKLADMNDDGYIDFLAVRGGEMVKIILYYNTGDGGFVNQTSILPQVFHRWVVAFNIGDFDNDGDTDIFACTGDNKYHVIKNIKPFDVWNTEIDSPLTPTLVSPENTGIVSKSPTLSWEENNLTKSYRLQVATDPNFNNIIINKGTIILNYYTIDLNSIQTFYWRIRGSNTGGDGEWSETWTFTTENSAPTSILLSSNGIIDHLPTNKAVGDFLAADPDHNDIHTYSFLTGDGINDIDNNCFIIDGNTLKTNVEIDLLTKSRYSIYIQTDDEFGGIFKQAFVLYVIPYGVTAYFPFNGSANDQSGNGYDGLIVGPTLTTDRFDIENSAYSFDGVDDVIQLGAGLNLVNNSDKFTFAAWIYPYQISPTDTWRYYTILGEIWNICNYQFGIMDNALYLSFWSDGDEYIFRGNDGQIEAGKWQFITATYDGENMTFYINAERDTTTPASGDIDGNELTLYVGSTDGYSSLFHGKIDDLFIYNRALSETEIQQLFMSME